MDSNRNPTVTLYWIVLTAGRKSACRSKSHCRTPPLCKVCLVNAATEMKLTPAEAQALCSVVETQRKAIEMADHEKRLKRLEKASATRF
jgi:hypothetical protein